MVLNEAISFNAYPGGFRGIIAIRPELPLWPAASLLAGALAVSPVHAGPQAVADTTQAPAQRNQVNGHRSICRMNCERPDVLRRHPGAELSLDHQGRRSQCRYLSWAPGFDRACNQPIVDASCKPDPPNGSQSVGRGQTSSSTGMGRQRPAMASRIATAMCGSSKCAMDGQHR